MRLLGQQQCEQGKEYFDEKKRLRSTELKEGILVLQYSTKIVNKIGKN